MGHNLKTLAKEILRWGVIAASVGGSVRLLMEARMRWNGDWLGLACMLIFSLGVAAPLLAVAYICLRRQYRKLFLVLGLIGSLAIFVELWALPDQLGLFQFMERHMGANHDYAFLALPLCLFMLFGPAYAAGGFYNLCHRLAYPLPAWARRPRTRATRWLVWSGIALMLLSVTIAAASMLIAATAAAKSPHHALPPEPSLNLVLWSGELPLLGALLVFLGLARRQPIAKPSDETFPPDTE